MSHIVTIKTEIRDAGAVRAACQRLRLPPPVEGTHKVYSSHAAGLAVQLPKCRFPAVCQLDTGQVQYDNFNGRWGEQKHLDAFLQGYAVEKARIEARRQGHRLALLTGVSDARYFPLQCRRTKTMHLILNVHSSNPETNLGCECALLRVTKPFCNRLQRDVEILFRHQRELPDLYEVYFWRYGIEFYAYDLIAACDDCEDGWGDRFENAGRAPLPEGVDLAKFEPQRIECPQEIFRYERAASNIVRLPEKCFEICWTATPRHSDIYITTHAVTLPELGRYLAQEKVPAKPQKRRRGTKSRTA